MWIISTHSTRLSSAITPYPTLYRNVSLKRHHPTDSWALNKLDLLPDKHLLRPHNWWRYSRHSSRYCLCAAHFFFTSSLLSTCETCHLTRPHYHPRLPLTPLCTAMFPWIVITHQIHEPWTSSMLLPDKHLLRPHNWWYTPPFARVVPYSWCKKMWKKTSIPLENTYNRTTNDRVLQYMICHSLITATSIFALICTGQIIIFGAHQDQQTWSKNYLLCRI